jgi:hypothetical protein
VDCNKLVPAVRGADRRHPRSETGGRKRCWDLREVAAEKAAGISELLADLASRLRSVQATHTSQPGVYCLTL